LLVFAVLVKNTLQDGTIAFCDLPVFAHLGKRVDEEYYVGAHGVSDGRAMYEQQASTDPQSEGKGGPEFVEHIVVHDETSHGKDIINS
jgi:hypothetical protein